VSSILTSHSNGLVYTTPTERGIKVDDGPVAQLVRAPPCHGGGRQFKSGQDRTALIV